MMSAPLQFVCGQKPFVAQSGQARIHGRKRVPQPTQGGVAVGFVERLPANTLGLPNLDARKGRRFIARRAAQVVAPAVARAGQGHEGRHAEQGEGQDLPQAAGGLLGHGLGPGLALAGGGGRLQRPPARAARGSGRELAQQRRPARLAAASSVGLCPSRPRAGVQSMQLPHSSYDVKFHH